MRQRVTHAEHGYAMVALLVMMSVMAIAMTVAMPAWHTAAQREREAELIFRGEQYARAIAMFQRKYAGQFPPSIDVLMNEHFLRKKYKDPITGGDFQLVGPGDALQGAAGALADGAAGTAGAAGPGASPGQPGTTGGRSTMSVGRAPQTSAGRAQASTGRGGGIMGVASKSKDKSLRLYNGRDKYNEWVFVGTQATTQAGSPTGGRNPGLPAGRGGAPGAPRGGAPPREGGPGGGGLSR